MAAQRTPSGANCEEGAGPCCRRGSDGVADAKSSAHLPLPVGKAGSGTFHRESPTSRGVARVSQGLNPPPFLMSRHTCMCRTDPLYNTIPKGSNIRPTIPIKFTMGAKSAEGAILEANPAAKTSDFEAVHTPANVVEWVRHHRKRLTARSSNAQMIPSQSPSALIGNPRRSATRIVGYQRATFWR